MFVCIGLDVHAKMITSFATPLDAMDAECAEFCREFTAEFKKTAADRASLERMASWLDGVDHSILIENSTKTHEVFWTLVDAGCTVVVAKASDLFRITKSVKKTDRHDCEELAHYMRRRMMGEEEFSQCLMVDSVWMNRRQLCRIYAQTSSDLSDLRRRIRSFMLLRGITVGAAVRDIVGKKSLDALEMNAESSLRFLIDDARFKNKRLREVKSAIEKEFENVELYKLISSVPGFGTVTSSYLAAMVVDIKRFGTADEFSAYFGIVPKQRESADHAKKCGITRRGDAVARKMLIEGTFHHISMDRDRESSVSRMYDRLISRGFPHKKALTACGNKMARILFAMLSSGERYKI